MDIRTDRALIPAGQTVTRYLTVTFTAPARERHTDRPAVQVALVLDRSGSMAGSKIEMARRAVDHSIRLLDTRDRLALVCYDTEVDTLLGATAATPEAKKLALDRLGNIGARGSTDLCGGWLRGAGELDAPVTATPAAAEPTSLRRVLLLSDGLANHGETNPDALALHATTLREKGIATSTFGIGADFDEVLMSRLATEGGGHFYFIEHAAQIPDFLASELGDTLDIVAAGARLIVASNPDVTVTCLSGFATETVPATAGPGPELQVRLGDLVASQDVTIVLAVRRLAHVTSPVAISLRLADRDAALVADATRVEWPVASNEAIAAQPVNIQMLEVVATAIAERARTVALKANRRSDYGEAAEVLNLAIETIRGLAPGTPSLDAIASELERRLHQFTEAMNPVQRKSEHFSNYAVSMSRAEDGRARRRG